MNRNRRSGRGSCHNNRATTGAARQNVPSEYSHLGTPKQFDSQNELCVIGPQIGHVRHAVLMNLYSFSALDESSLKPVHVE
jgi:hypothetical protein